MKTYLSREAQFDRSAALVLDVLKRETELGFGRTVTDAAHGIAIVLRPYRLGIVGDILFVTHPTGAGRHGCLGISGKGYQIGGMRYRWREGQEVYRGRKRIGGCDAYWLSDGGFDWSGPYKIVRLGFPGRLANLSPLDPAIRVWALDESARRVGIRSAGAGWRVSADTPPISRFRVSP